MALRNSRRASLATLLVFLLAICLVPQRVEGSEFTSLSVKAGEIAPVAAADQVSSNQAFAKTWQVRKGAGASVVDEIKWTLPGRVFISYAESASSDLLAEVVVAGSSKELIEPIDVYSDGGITVSNFGLTDAAGGYLLTEIKLHQKRTVKRLSPGGSGEAVVLDNVLYSKTKEAYTALATSSAPTSTISDVKLIEGKSSSGSRNWNLTSSNKNSKVSFDLSIPGKVRFGTLKPAEASPGTIAKITLTEELTYYDTATSYTKIPVDKLEVVASAVDDTESVALRVKSSFNAQGKDLQIVTFIDVLPSVQVSVSNSVASYFEDIRLSVPTDGFSTFFLMEGNGSVFVSDKDAKLFWDGADLTGTNGDLQLDVGELSSTSMLVGYGGVGSLSVFAETISVGTPISASTDGTGKICLSSTNDLVVNQLNPAKLTQVSYPGKPGGAEKCVKRDLPERVPGKTVIVKYGGDGSSASSSSTPKPKAKSTAGSSSASGVVKVKDSAAGSVKAAGAAVLSAVAVVVAMAV